MKSIDSLQNGVYLRVAWTINMNTKLKPKAHLLKRRFPQNILWRLYVKRKLVSVTKDETSV